MEEISGVYKKNMRRVSMYIFIRSAIYSTLKYWYLHLLCPAMLIISTSLSSVLLYACVWKGMTETLLGPA